MLAMMPIHVDQLDGLLRASDRCLGDGRAIADEGDHRPIVVRVDLLIQDTNARNGGDGLGDGIDDLRAAPLGEIRDALHDLRHVGACGATNVRVH